LTTTTAMTEPPSRILAIAHELGGVAGVVSMWAHVLSSADGEAQRSRAAEALRAAADEQSRLVEELVALVRSTA